MGTLYLFHITPPYEHAGHYLGYTDAPTRRFKRHLAGQGSPLIRAALEAGHEVTLAKTWPGTRTEERRLKQMGSYGASLCPVCRPRYLAARRARRKKSETAA